LRYGGAALVKLSGCGVIVVAGYSENEEIQ
jgi:hypothetical protein